MIMRLSVLRLASASLVLTAATPASRVRAIAPPAETVVFAGGCFWGIQEVFEHVKGVTSTEAGFSGGAAPSPTYEDVSTGTTGYAESVRITFDPSRVSFGQLLQIFFSVAHDPTQLDRQGPDVGPQYRSVIFYTTAAQRALATSYIAQLTRAHTFRRPIVTEVQPLAAFHPAEAYHQDYAEHHPDDPYIAINDAPKIVNLRREFASEYRPATHD
jgi:peptide-methionine (S)-S-oxide reductase